MKELPKIYTPQKYEDTTYQKWEESGYFNPDSLPGKRKKVFSIALPPPNVTGELHVGHAAMLAYQDIMIRYHRLKGEKVLWLPGMDHAAIATQNVVEKEINKKGKSRYDLDREEFLNKVNDFAAKSKSVIRNQIKKMGSSLDWSREKFTLDKDLSTAVRTVFKKMYDDGLIYQGDRVVHWCPRCQSTLADDEVEYIEKKAPFYYFKYGPVVIGTARPETKFSDKVIVVHPSDKRYKDIIGKEFEVEWINGKIKAKVIADPVAEMEMGTGAMTITPAHSFVDFELAQKYKLKIEQIINKEGKLTEVAGKFAGLPVEKARPKVVEILNKKGLVEKIDKNYVHNLSICYRCKTPIEPLTSKQWFINVNKKIPHRGKSLKQLASEVVKKGDINIIPERFNKTYFQWMDNLRDWCISRQIWYGHRIPVWYQKSNKAVEIVYYVHGTTVDNEKGLASGHADVQLSKLGIKQSKDLKNEVKDEKFDAIFCSDFKRATQTAEIAFDKKVIKDKRLREVDYGDLSQQQTKEVYKQKLNRITETFSSGESYKDVEKRIKDFLSDLAKKYQGKRIAIVAHQAPQLALEVLLKNKTWEQAIKEDWREKKAWQPGWSYNLSKGNDEVIVPKEIIELSLIRHGLTDWNKEDRTHGRIDAPLDESSVEQIKKEIPRFKNEQYDLILTSPLMRARQTAEIINKELKLPLEVDELLTERDYGDFEGKTVKEIKKDHPDYHKNKVGYDIPGDEETYQELAIRAEKFLKKISKQYAGKRILAVCHNGLIRAFKMVIDGGTAQELSKFSSPFPQLNKFSILDGKFDYSKIKQDEDTLDTWFSSSLWTFSTLGWPNKTEDLKNYHPTSVMETGYDILFFWVARMIIMSSYALKEIPFETVYLHGLVRDKEGRKMSKSLGNGIDPLEMIEKFGADALRLSMIVGATPGNDIRLYEEKIAGYRNFVNKLWNINRYILTSVKEIKSVTAKDIEPKTLADYWILNEFNLVIQKITDLLEGFKFSSAGEELYEFTWSKLADWYLEIAKIEGDKDKILLYIIERLLILWHPFCPYVTEVLWEQFGSDELLMIKQWPESEIRISKSEFQNFEFVQKVISSIRNARTEHKANPKKTFSCSIETPEKKVIEENIKVIEGLSKTKITPRSSGIKINLASAVITLDIKENVEVAKNRHKETQNLERYIQIQKGKLSNGSFFKKAPKKVIDSEKEKLKQAEEKLKKLSNQ